MEFCSICVPYKNDNSNELNYNNLDMYINIPSGLFAGIAIALAVNEDIFWGMQIFPVN